MATLYDRPDIFDLFESEQKYQITRKHWDVVFDGKNIHSVLDVSIGSGNLTLPIVDMGIELFGSDLSEAMLSKCMKKATDRGQSINLRPCDFRSLTEHFDRKFDCVISTGNSLPYVPNNEITGVLEQMDALVNDGGYIYFDVRNWDKIVSQKQRFYLYNPHFDGENRINLVQAWDHHADGSITFNLLFTFEQNNRIFQQEIFEEHYYPVKQEILIDKLKDMGYTDIQIMPFPAQYGAFDIDKSDWYSVMAKK